MSAYSANITGSDPFWSRRRSELQATFEQKKIATLFFTFSYADNHIPDLHRLFPGKPSKTKSERQIIFIYKIFNFFLILLF